MNSHYLRRKKKWTAYTTINGVDVYELGDTEKQARDKLANRIANSDFSFEGHSSKNITVWQHLDQFKKILKLS